MLTLLCCTMLDRGINSHLHSFFVCSSGDVRLQDGQHHYQGRVEIMIDNEWGTVCDKSFDINDASVVCRQVGYPGAVEVVPKVYTSFKLLSK